MPEPFALLLPVCDSDSEQFLTRAFTSAVVDQTLRPDEVVLVRDGAVHASLQQTIDTLRAQSPVPVKYVPLPHNGGLGRALDAGLEASSYDVVARMDADDVSMPHRFAVQLPLIAEADILGAALLEFGTDIDDIVGKRVPPTQPDEIRAYARLHDPFNHPTVVYRRQAVLASGGYGDLPLMEDYWLFARMLADGAEPLNVAEPLLYYRVGAGAYQRRGGTTLLQSELQLQRLMRNGGITTPAQYARNLMVRGSYRLVPWQLRRAVYRRVFVSRHDHPAAAAEPPTPPERPEHPDRPDRPTVGAAA
ncbi:MAG: glycosyltransferase [Jatrophihabitans sp.]|uniref:glycosyltransferase n=1 Tax=Jatrophihabitans sp. TaxID=1932789 RepID=UPI003F804B20